jgi:predicted membrane channel-forming protein YqfA (hemolysin III family)
LNVVEIYKINHFFSGYRLPNSSFFCCIKSLLKLNNNDVVYFWTHFIAFGYFIIQFIKVYTSITNEQELVIIWPMVIYMTTVCFFLLMSSIAHAFNCMSSRARHICFCLDYIGISLYGLGCGIAFNAYTLTIDQTYRHHWFFKYYVASSILVITPMNTMSCASRFILSKNKRAIMRTSSFIIQYLFVSLPLFYRFYLHFTASSGSSFLNNQSDLFYLIQFGTAFVSIVLYVSRVPESIWPGHFDIIGQSHQIFHITTSISTWFQVKALSMDLNYVLNTCRNDANSFQLNKDYFTVSQLFNFKLTYSFIFVVTILINVLILFYYYSKATYNNPWLDYNQINFKYEFHHHHHHSHLSHSNKKTTMNFNQHNHGPYMESCCSFSDFHFLLFNNSQKNGIEKEIYDENNNVIIHNDTNDDNKKKDN